MQAIKCVCVGDNFVGKSCLIHTYMSRELYGKSQPLALTEHFTRDVTVDGRPFTLELLNTPGQEDYDRFRPLSYQKNTDVFVICFSIVYPDSLQNVYLKWLLEIRHFCSSTPIVLVGTKSDLREDPETLERLRGMNQAPITYEQGQAMSKYIRAVKYIECSALQLKSLDDLFDEVIRVILKKNSKLFTSTDCVLL